ncbi:hypothetical protein [Flavisolibacter ginsenosidimutans]|uniref:Uncharacterized protein n=1 Tax=Flavisolibacter ginsenosidimutans TaxID=661481 RepID=A0A5B8UKF3_9BACT|nr:hypothetical protein [Flavisolibacter ginsenosidimutans]QEC56495.1 hypothetical protein FSB75_11510 [Flavisolibacter ginsenosidimutans]
MPNKFDKLVNEAARRTDAEFSNQFTSLTRLTDDDTEKLINDTGISKEDLAKVLKEVKDATASNEQKAAAIQNINNGVSALVAIAKKFL